MQTRLHSGERESEHGRDLVAGKFVNIAQPVDGAELGLKLGDGVLQQLLHLGCGDDLFGNSGFVVELMAGCLHFGELH